MAVLNAGTSAFPNFRENLGLLKAIGVTDDDFVLDVLAVDKPNAHKIFHALAQDPDKAAALVGMDPRRRTVELTRISMAHAAPAADPAPALAPKAPAPVKVSKAPAPPPAVEPSTSKTVDWRSDDVSDADFSRGWEENAKTRRRRG